MWFPAHKKQHKAITAYLNHWGMNCSMANDIPFHNIGIAGCAMSIKRSETSCYFFIAWHFPELIYNKILPDMSLVQSTDHCACRATWLWTCMHRRCSHKYQCMILKQMLNCARQVLNSTSAFSSASSHGCSKLKPHIQTATRGCSTECLL